MPSGFDRLDPIIRKAVVQTPATQPVNAQVTPQPVATVAPAVAQPAAPAPVTPAPVTPAPQPVAPVPTDAGIPTSSPADTAEGGVKGVVNVGDYISKTTALNSDPNLTDQQKLQNILNNFPPLIQPPPVSEDLGLTAEQAALKQDLAAKNSTAQRTAYIAGLPADQQKLYNDYEAAKEKASEGFLGNPANFLLGGLGLILGADALAGALGLTGAAAAPAAAAPAASDLSEVALSANAVPTTMNPAIQALANSMTPATAATIPAAAEAATAGNLGEIAVNASRLAPSVLGNSVVPAVLAGASEESLSGFDPTSGSTGSIMGNAPYEGVKPNQTLPVETATPAAGNLGEVAVTGSKLGATNLGNALLPIGAGFTAALANAGVPSDPGINAATVSNAVTPPDSALAPYITTPTVVDPLSAAGIAARIAPNLAGTGLSLSQILGTLGSAASKIFGGGGAATGAGGGAGAGGAGAGGAGQQLFQAPGIVQANIPQAYTYEMGNYQAPQTLPLGQYAAYNPRVALPQYAAAQQAAQGGLQDVSGGMSQDQLAALAAALQGQA